MNPPGRPSSQDTRQYVVLNTSRSLVTRTDGSLCFSTSLSRSSAPDTTMDTRVGGIGFLHCLQRFMLEYRPASVPRRRPALRSARRRIDARGRSGGCTSPARVARVPWSLGSFLIGLVTDLPHYGLGRLGTLPTC